MFKLLPFIDILAVPKTMLGKSTSFPIAPSKPNSKSPHTIHHRDMTNIKLPSQPGSDALAECSREIRTLLINQPGSDALAECSREIRTLLIKKSSYSLQKVYKLLDDAFFDSQIGKIARIMQCKTEISAGTEIGSHLRCDAQGGIVICLPARGVKSAQEVITILLREMAAINFWKVDSCSCGECRCDKSGSKMCDFVHYLSELNAMVNFHLKGFRDQWRIQSSEYLVLKDVIKVLQDAKQVDQEFADIFETAKPTPEVSFLVEEPLEKQDAAPEVSSLVEESRKKQDVAPEFTSPVEEPLEKEDTTPEVNLLLEEPLEKEDTAPAVTLLVEEPLEKQITAPELVGEPVEKEHSVPEVTSPVEEPLEKEDTAAELPSLVEEPLEKQDTAAEVTSPVEEPLGKQNTASKVTSLVEARSRIPRFVMT